MKSMGLDLSLLATGVCVLSGEVDSVPEKYTTLLKMSRTKSVKESIDRLIAIARGVIALVQEHSPDVVVIEAPAMNQKWQAAAIGELHGVIKTQLYLACGIVPLVEQSTKLRTAVVGKIERSFEQTTDGKGKPKRRVTYGQIPGKGGRMKKATIKDIVELRLKALGLEFPNQDEMDAFVCAKYGWERMR